MSHQKVSQLTNRTTSIKSRYVSEENIKKSLRELQSSHEVHPRIKEQRISKFLNSIRQSNQLRGRGNYSLEIYEDALNRTLCWVALNLDRYDEQKGEFMPWVNYRLQKYLWEVKQEIIEPLIQSNQRQIFQVKHKLSTLINKVDKQAISYLFIKIEQPSILFWLGMMKALKQLKKNDKQAFNNLLLYLAEQIVSSTPKNRVCYEKVSDYEIGFQSLLETKPCLLDLTRYSIESDHCKLFKIHPKNNPDATFQKIFLARLDNESWVKLSKEFDINVSSLKNFFHRNLNKFSGVIREEIQQLTI